MYVKEYPEVDDLVVVKVKNIAEMGAYCDLLEYNNIEGLILMSELSRRRIRSVNKLIRVGRQEIVLVLRVNKEKGYIDLSKRRVNIDDRGACEERWNKAKAVHSIMRHVASKCKWEQKHSENPVEDLYLAFGWAMYKHPGFKHGYDGFRLAMSDQEKFFATFDVPEEVKEELIENIQRRLAPTVCKIRADVELTCYAYQGINAIKAALKEADEMDSKDFPLDIQLVAPPLYSITTQTMDKEGGIAKLNEVIARIQEVIQAPSLGGNCKVTEVPRIVSGRDDAGPGAEGAEGEAANQQEPAD